GKSNVTNGKRFTNIVLNSPGRHGDSRCSPGIRTTPAAWEGPTQTPHKPDCRRKRGTGSGRLPVLLTNTKATYVIFPIGDEQVQGGHKPLLAYILIGINVLVFFLQLSIPPGEQQAFVNTYGMIPAEVT